VNPTQLYTAAGTSDFMKKVAESYPPFDLLKAYRDAKEHLRTSDIVLVIADNGEGFQAFARPAYIELAFKRLSDKLRAVHPLHESAHKKLRVPADDVAFWLAVEFHDKGATGFCAVGALRPLVVN